MPSQANAKHADTSRAKNRRSPHLYPSRRSQESTYAGGCPLLLPCACTHYRQSWHPVEKKRRGIKKKADRSQKCGCSVLVSGGIVKHCSQASCWRPTYPFVMWKYILPWPHNLTRQQDQVAVGCFCWRRRQHRFAHDISKCSYTGMCVKSKVVHTVWEIHAYCLSGSEFDDLFSVVCQSEKKKVLFETQKIRQFS